MNGNETTAAKPVSVNFTGAYSFKFSFQKHFTE